DAQRPPVAAEEVEPDAEGRRQLVGALERERRGRGARRLSVPAAAPALLDADHRAARGDVEIGIEEDLVEDGELAAEGDERGLEGTRPLHLRRLVGESRRAAPLGGAAVATRVVHV